MDTHAPTARDLADQHDRDLAAILIVRPRDRTQLLDALAAAGNLAAVALRVLEWVDELLLPREADDLHLALELQAQVAIASTTDMPNTPT